MTWKALAVQLYFRLYGKRCILCFRDLDATDVQMRSREAHGSQVQVGDEEIFLMHKKCVKDSYENV